MEIYYPAYRNQQVVIHTDNSHIAKSYTRGKFYEQPLLEHLLQFSGTFLDIGAHVGNHSVFLSLFGGYKRIVSIEPCPEHYRTLLANIRTNKCNNISPYNLAATDRVCRFNINRTGPNDGAYSLTNGLEVQGLPMSTLIDTVDVIKYDVEGHEPRSLAGTASLIDRCKPRIYIELNSNVDHIKTFLKQHGYSLKTIFRMGSPVGEFLCH